MTGVFWMKMTTVSSPVMIAMLLLVLVPASNVIWQLKAGPSAPVNVGLGFICALCVLLWQQHPSSHLISVAKTCSSFDPTSKYVTQDACDSDDSVAGCGFTCDAGYVFDNTDKETQGHFFCDSLTSDYSQSIKCVGMWRCLPWRCLPTFSKKLFSINPSSILFSLSFSDHREARVTLYLFYGFRNGLLSLEQLPDC